MALILKECDHLQQFDFEQRKMPLAYECAQCVEEGGSWVHLRTCQSCGITLCCDSSPNKHASKHFEKEGHEIITSAEPGEHWAWCYPHKSFKKYE